MPIDLPSFKEDHISQVPALQLLINLGWEYLTPAEALAARGGKCSGVLLDSILEAQLRRMNRFEFKGATYPFSEGAINSAVQALKEVPFDGLIRTNEKIYDLLTLGKSLQQSIQGDLKKLTLNYIDWKNLANNAFHVTEEFAVERTGSHETRRPDLALFVNGIPLAVIECKRPDVDKAIEQAVSQQIRNQKEDEIPKLFIYSQLLMVVSKNEARYATTGTGASFWFVWKEKAKVDGPLGKLVNAPLAAGVKDKLFTERFRYVRAYFDEIEASGREITEQDRAIYALCRPERLLEFTFHYTLYDAGEKKIARYQQYFCVQKIMDRIRKQEQGGLRPGGVVWHTQGSGKSLTMVMLAKAIALEASIVDPKIVLVTDRVDLDDQIYKTFEACGTEPENAKTGVDLITLLKSKKSRIIATTIFKFEAGVSRKAESVDSPDIFVLVDESHRTNYGETHAKMRKVLPNACYIGFTGTPLVKKEKNTILKFGGLIDTYTMSEAVDDGAVVPLLYEGRHVPQDVEDKMIDSWFDKITENLNPEQKADLKKKFARADQLNRAEQKIMVIAWDVGSHYEDNWKGTGFKAQLVADRKTTALRYKHYLDQFGKVKCEVLISGPDEREGEEEIYGESEEPVKQFWKKMMDKYGTEKEYNRQLIGSFKAGDEPEIIIVVDKLLTGFDAPRNTVLYLTRKLEEHTLLQAIARVNRRYPGKDWGYILDYYGILSKLGEALDLYGALADFDNKDLADLEKAIIDVAEYLKNLPQIHSNLREIFKGVKKKLDEEEYERVLQDEKTWDEFQKRLSKFNRGLAVALSSDKFIRETPDKKVNLYKDDLKFFMNLRSAVSKRFSRDVDYKEYEEKIQKLIDTHVGAKEVVQITPLVNIFDREKFKREVERIEGKASQADTIASRTQKTITERWAEDPAFYEKFSELIREAIKAFYEGRISDAEYLKRVKDAMNSVVNRTGDDLPDSLKGHDVAKAFFGIVHRTFAEGEDVSGAEVEADIAIKIDEIIQRLKIVNWENNPDVQNRMRNEIEDYLFEAKKEHGADFSFDDIDKIMEDCLNVAKVRYSS